MIIKQNLKVCHINKIKQRIKLQIQTMKKILKLLIIFFLLNPVNLFSQDLPKLSPDSASTTNPNLRPVQPVAPIPTIPPPIPTPAGSNSSDNSYKNAFENFKNGRLEDAIKELNNNCIPSISTGNALIYKAYKLLITCYKNINKDGTAKTKLKELSVKVGKDETSVQQTLDNTVL